MRFACVLPLALSIACAPAEAVTLPILGGTTPGACEWPTVVSVRSSTIHCTGVLVRPDLVLYAGHCGADITTVYLGGTVSGPSVATRRCVVHPLFTEGNLQHDIAACELMTPVDVPIVPIASECELDLAETDRLDAVTVGAGRDGAGGLGIKRAIASRVFGYAYSGGTIGANRQILMLPTGAMEGICPGDSGGPDFVRLPDGTYRVLGVHSMAGSDCRADTWMSSPVPLSLPWLESEFGDVTPCRDAGGAWMAGCDVPLHPDVATGTWSACTFGESTPLLDGCATSGLDAGSFDAASFDAAGIDAASFDAAGIDAASFDAGSTDAVASSDAPGSEPVDASRGDGGARDAGVTVAPAGCGCRAGAPHRGHATLLLVLCFALRALRRARRMPR